MVVRRRYNLLLPQIRHPSTFREAGSRGIQVWGIRVAAIRCSLDAPTHGLRFLFDYHETGRARSVRSLARDLEDWGMVVELVR